MVRDGGRNTSVASVKKREWALDEVSSTTSSHLGPAFSKGELAVGTTETNLLFTRARDLLSMTKTRHAVNLVGFTSQSRTFANVFGVGGLCERGNVRAEDKGIYKAGKINDYLPALMPMSLASLTSPSPYSSLSDPPLRPPNAYVVRENMKGWVLEVKPPYRRLRQSHRRTLLDLDAASLSGKRQTGRGWFP